MAVAGYAQVIGAAYVGAELECVVAMLIRPVIDELNLPLVLAQRTVARRDAQRVAEVETCHAVNEEGWHASGEVVVVQTRNARVFRRSGLPLPRIDIHAIAVKAEAEVGRPVGVQGVVEAGSEALIARLGFAGEV